MKTNPHDCISPVVETTDNSTFSMQCREWGLTKREYFAAMALQGMAASAHWDENFSSNKVYLEQATKVAVLAAEELIAALNKQP